MDENIKETLLKLPDIEKHEREVVRKDYIFYKGRCVKPIKEVGEDKALLGQNWETNDNCDYTPTQDIRNKIKPRLKKQARWMFGVEPTLKLKADDKKDKDKCEELRKFIDNVLDDNSFWPTTKNAFLEATIKKRVLLRVEANPNMPLIIKYESIENFYYKEKNGKLLEVTFFEEDEKNVFVEDETEKIYYLHTYYYNFTETERQAWYKKETYFDAKLQKELTLEQDTGFTNIPCWLIKNSAELNDGFGESDVEELMEEQNQYNKTISDFRDALRFMMFGAESIIDANPDDVAKLKIAPNAMHAVRTRDELLAAGKQATMQRLEYSMGNSSAIEAYLDRTEADMDDTMDMPKLKDLNNIPSAKAMGYLYNDLMGRCDEKWNDWNPAFLGLLSFIKEVAPVCYPGTYKKEWNNLMYTTLFEHNYPLPSDTEEKKKTAMEEVAAGVKSHQSYIKDHSDVEDAEVEWNEVLEEKAQITNAETDQMNVVADTELDNIDNATNDNIGTN